MAVDFSRSRALGHYARKYQSQALEADALHFSTDIWSSGVVLLGLAGAWAGGPLERALAEQRRHGGRPRAWPPSSSGVSLRLGKKSLDDLLDRIPVDLQERVAQAAAQVAGVLQVTKVRLRRSGPEIFADVTLSVGQATSFEKAHEIADQAAAAVRAILPRADVVVHAEPVVAPEEELTTTVRVLAARHGLGAHGIRIFDDAGQRWIELHLEVSGQLSVEEAHRQATEFEKELRATVPGLGRIVSHLEPVGDATATVRGEPAAQTQVRAALADFYRKHGFPLDPAQHRRPMGRRRVAGLLPLPPGGDHGPDRRPRLDRAAWRSFSAAGFATWVAWSFTSSRSRPAAKMRRCCLSHSPPGGGLVGNGAGARVGREHVRQFVLPHAHRLRPVGTEAVKLAPFPASFPPDAAGGRGVRGITGAIADYRFSPSFPVSPLFPLIALPWSLVPGPWSLVCRSTFPQTKINFTGIV